MTLFFNATEGPLVIDDDGHSVGGWEWFEADLTDQIRRAIERDEVVRINQSRASKYDNIPIAVSPEKQEPVEVPAE